MLLALAADAELAVESAWSKAEATAVTGIGSKTPL